MIKFFSVTGKRIVLFMFFTFGFSQWAGYDVHQEEYSSTDLRIFIEGKTFGLSANPALIISPKNRAYVGIGLSKNTLFRPNTYQKQLSGWVPNFSADIFITNNLYFIGRISQFYSEEDIVHSHNFGFALKSGDDVSYPWQTSVVFCNLSGPQDFALRSVSLTMAILIQAADHQIQIGIGKEMYSAKIFLEDANFPTAMKGEINYILLGMNFERDSIGIFPQIRFHPRLIGTSVRMTWGIG